MDDFKDQFDENQVKIQFAKSMTPKLMKHLNYNQNRKFRRQKRKNKSTTINPVRADMISTTVKDFEGELSFSEKRKMGQSSRCLKKCKRQMDINGNHVYGRIQPNGLNGKTQINFVNGSNFKGRFLNGKILEGRFQFTNGFIYQGGYMFNKFFGQGTLRFPDGKQIIGDWDAQKIIGNAQIRYLTGQIYYGQILNFQKHGFGYLFLADGTKFVGQFKQGKIQGKGSLFKKQTLVGQGYWENGQLLEALPLQSYSFKQLNFTTFGQNSLQKLKISDHLNCQQASRGSQIPKNRKKQRIVSLKIQVKQDQEVGDEQLSSYNSYTQFSEAANFCLDKSIKA